MNLFENLCMLKENEEINEFEPEVVEQEISSAATSINSSKLPAIFKLIQFQKGQVNLDVGGGRFDNVAEELAKIGAINLVWDPYNRSAEHNNEVLQKIKENGGADSTTCSNVLNVIKEQEARLGVIKNCYKFAKSGANCYFTVYEGKLDGAPGLTKAGYQMNQKTKYYVDEIKQVFGNVTIKGKLITAMK